MPEITDCTQYCSEAVSLEVTVYVLVSLAFDDRLG